MSKQKEIDKQRQINNYRIGLLNLDLILDFLRLLNPNEENQIPKGTNKVTYGNKTYTIVYEGNNGSSSLTIKCSNNRNLRIGLVSTIDHYTEDGFWDATQTKRKMDISVSFSKENRSICFTRKMSYEDFLALTNNSFATLLSGLSWAYIEKCKDIILSETELDFIYNTINPSGMQEEEKGITDLQHDVYRRALDKFE